MMLRIAFIGSLALLFTSCGSQPEKATTERNMIGCKLRQDLIDLATMRDRDDDSFGMSILNALKSGACKRYLAGTDILIDREEKISDKKYACIRVAEETSCYWSAIQ